jgi:glycerate dehydrogenase
LNHPAYYDKFVKSGKYSRSAMFTSLERDIYELKGKELGIIGLGTIGRKVAEIASVFGANVSYFSTSGRNDDPIYKRKELNDLLRESDIISIHSPLNEETKGLIGENQLKMMKASSIIINTGRGGIIIEKDLVKALNKNWIFSAAVDVFEKEPLPASHPYLKVKNREKLLLTPHIAWASVEARRELLRGIYRNIDTYLKEKK